MLSLVPLATLALTSALAVETVAPPTPPAAFTAPPTTSAWGFAPLDRSIIPAEARWIAHVEVQRILNSKIFEIAREHEPDLHFNGRDFQELREHLGFDPTEEVRSVTVFGLPRHEEAAVAMIRASSVADQAIAKLDEYLERTEVEVDGVEITHWTEDGGGDDVYTYLARKADSDERMLLAAGHPGDLADAVSALRGEIDSLADIDNGLDTDMDDKAFVFVSASGALAHLADVEQASQIGRIVDKARVQVGEDGGKLFLDVAIDAKSAEKVRQVTALLQGLRALASLASSAEPELAQIMPLLDRLHMTADGRRLNIHFEEDIDALVAMAEKVSGGGQEDFSNRRSESAKPKAKAREGREWY